MHDEQPHPRPARSQAAGTAILVALSLAAGIAFGVAATGLVSPAQRGAGLTDAQKRASIIARVEVVDEGTGADSAAVTMSSGHFRDGAALPDWLETKLDVRSH